MRWTADDVAGKVVACGVASLQGARAPSRYSHFPLGSAMHMAVIQMPGFSHVGDCEKN